MGFISNITGALSESVRSELKDQYLEFFTTDSLGQDMLVKRAHRLNNTGRNKGSSEIISAGSKVIVPEGAYAVMTDGGAVVDSVTEPGLYTWENSSSGSVMSGGLESVFGDAFERFKFGGEITRIQRIYYINGLEIMNQTSNEYLQVPYPDPIYGVLYLKFRITFSFRIVDPVKFFKITPKDTSVYSFMGSSAKPNMPFLEVQDHMEEALNLCATRDKVPFPILLSNKSRLRDAVNEAVSKVWLEKRGMVVVSIALTDLTLDPDSRKRVEEFDSARLYANNPDALKALVALGLTDAVKAAGSNPSGAISGLAGVGMAYAVANNMGMTNTPATPNVAVPDVSGQSVSGLGTCPFCGTPLPSGQPLEQCPACCADIRSYYSK